MAHFDRERIPERVVHAKGAGAFGFFEVTHDISKYCKASVFSKIGESLATLLGIWYVELFVNPNTKGPSGSIHLIPDS